MVLEIVLLFILLLLSIRGKLLEIVLLFVLLGPFVGYMVYWGPLIAIALSPFGYPAALWGAAIPAAATAIVYWSILKYKTQRNPHLLLRVLIGGVLGTVISMVFAAVSLDQFSTSTIIQSWAANN